MKRDDARLRLPVLAYIAVAQLGCGDDVAEPTYLDLRVRSDLTPGSELVYVSVEVLEAASDDALRTAWFNVAEDCQRDEEAGSSALFSLSLDGTGSEFTRLRVRGYTLDDVGAAAEYVTRTVEAAAPHGSGVLVLDLMERCSLERVRCSDGETCDPATGACAPVERIRDFMSLDAGPRVLDCGTTIEEPDTAARTYCRTGDESCPPGCTLAQDRDCRDAPGVACDRDDDCRTDLVCADGVCCNTVCEDACNSCNNLGHEGECSPIDYTASDDPAHCGGCGIVCGDVNARDVACDAGACALTCRDGFADCDGDRAAPNGCETEVLADEANCGGCALSCADSTGYPYCAGGECAVALGTPLPAGALEGDGYFLDTLWTVGTLVSVPEGRLFGLGAWLDAEDPSSPGQVAFALARRDAIGLPVESLAWTSPTPVRDAKARAEDGVAALTWAEVEPVTIDTETFYWLLIRASKPVRVRTDLGARPLYLLPVPSERLGFEGESYYGELEPQPQPALNAVAIIAR